MIYAWLTTRVLGLAKGWWVLAAVIALFAGWQLLKAIERADDKRNQEIGAAVQREGDLRETIKRVEEANEAREEVRNPAGSARYDECLRTARTPENCVRFLSGGETDQR